ncbi:LytTR family transcriptional regulator [Limosilactobacillus sp. Sa3CUN2]|uniref:LytTR family transcriptional regulator n=1 Tax=Limosilactobacillus avistercoris TaxID=2762243 RepID=A0ABR8P9Z5_9LACO|nr:LytTR family DNA-binding domain-containing protein [Limosilactobacillus avistercoris]MBD7894141.1 LytTR family transcriptional regulator [Limosilactobacillus avistercoris]
MKISFEKDPSLDQKEIQVEVHAVEKNITVRKLLDYLNSFKQRNRDLLPIKTPDRIITVKYDDIIKLEVQGTQVSIYTAKETIQTTGRLYKMLDQLSSDFIQVSRHAALNVNYLESIESGFAGNMVAILSNNLKTDVSRRFLPDLERELGL